MNWKFPLLSTEIILEQAAMIVDELAAGEWMKFVLHQLDLKTATRRHF